VSSTVLNLHPITTLDDEEQFIRLCEANPHLRLERDATGALVVMPPSGGEGSRREVGPVAALYAWNEQAARGIVVGPTAMFKLPTGPWRCPDAAWISKARWEALTPAQQRGVVPLAPDFVIEVRSPSDTRRELEARMHEWIDAGVRLAWLVDPDEGTATVFRPGQPPRELALATELSGDPELPGLTFRWRD
jgi:Uma2 family endonuclease